MKMRILFVDDEPNILEGLKRMLHPLRAEWDMVFAGGGEEALGLMANDKFDAIISDMRMPGMNGAELLNRVMQAHPNTIRFVLSGHSDQHLILRTVGSAHQYLNKPCDAATLKTVLERAFALRERLADPALERLASNLDSLPSLPGVYLEVMDALQTPEVSIDRIGELIAKDIGMMAKTLQLVNSAFFGLPQRITDPARAVNFLGLDIIRGMMLTVHVFSEFKKDADNGFSADALLTHSIAVGTLAKKIAKLEDVELSVVSDSMAAGMLHDSGKLLLAAHMPDEYRQANERSRSESIPLHEAESSIFHTSHAEIGAYLMGLWAFPDPVVEALAFHHKPEKDTSGAFSALTAVHVADCLVHEIHPATTVGHGGELRMEYLERLELTDRLPEWREVRNQTVGGEEVEDKDKNTVC